jgi:hypothetical protein
MQMLLKPLRLVGLRGSFCRRDAGFVLSNTAYLALVREPESLMARSQHVHQCVVHFSLGKDALLLYRSNFDVERWALRPV